MGRNPRGLIAALVAAGWCAVVVGALLVVPLVSTSTVTSEQPVARVERHTLVEEEGAGVLVAAAIPLVVAVAGAAAVGRRRARAVLIATTALLWAWVVVAGMSIGLLYLPAAVASCFALASSRSSQRTCSTSVT
jgi:hypothetical protein